MRAVLKSFLTLITIIASVLAITTNYTNFKDTASSDARFGFVLLAGFALFFLVIILIQNWRFSRNSRYAEAQSYFNCAFLQCNDIAQKDSVDERELELEIEKICEDIAKAFNIIIGFKCATCVKIVNQDPSQINDRAPNLTVRTLTRDSLSQRKRRKSQNFIHPLNRNTDFYTIFSPEFKDEYFYSNDLTGLHGYLNSSHDVCGEPSDSSIPVFGYILRNITWKLPYKSTIVAPIKDNSQNEGSVIGFFCIDSNNKGMFINKYDVQLIIDVAFSLYPLILKLNQITQNK